MLARTDSSQSPKIKKIARTFRLYGWISFLFQIGLAFAAILILIFASSGQKFSQDTSTGIGIGIFWASCSFMALCATIYLAYHYIRVAKGLLHRPEAILHPRKSETVELLRFGTIIGFVGILLGLFGTGSSLGVLIAKTVSQPPGMAITHPENIVRALDVFVVMANINLIAAHFVGVVISILLLEKLHLHHR
ncbi:MAG: DUF3611 family protein [Cyanobacteria bacterium J06598_4]